MEKKVVTLAEVKEGTIYVLYKKDHMYLNYCTRIEDGVCYFDEVAMHDKGSHKVHPKRYRGTSTLYLRKDADYQGYFVEVEEDDNKDTLEDFKQKWDEYLVNQDGVSQ